MLPPLASLDWSDAHDVTGHFRALLTECGHPMPRQAFLDGKATPVFEGLAHAAPRPFDASTLRDLAAGDSPQAYYRRLLGGDGSLAERSSRAGREIATLVATLGIWPFGTAWYKYPTQLERLRALLAATDRAEVNVLVHGTFNGEDAFSIATYLNQTLPERRVTVFGRDALPPIVDDLQWVARKTVPDVLAVDDYFESRTPHVVSLRPDMRSLVDLAVGDTFATEARLDRLDAVVINGVLGQAVSGTELPEHLRRIHAALAPGGSLLIDNKAYAIAHPELNAGLASAVSDLVERNAFRSEARDGDESKGRYVLRKT